MGISALGFIPALMLPRAPKAVDAESPGVMETVELV
jgi:hypothetical protein